MAYIAVGSSHVIKVDGIVLPGVVVGIEVSGTLRIEKQKNDGKSGSRQLIKGYAEPTIRIELELLAKDADAEIKALQAVFSRVEQKGVRVVNRHLDARGVKTLLFKGLTTRDDFDNNLVTASLEFTDYDSEIAQLEQKGANTAGTGSSGGNENANSNTGKDPPKDPKKQNKDENGKPKLPSVMDYLNKGVGDGSSVLGGN